VLAISFGCASPGTGWFGHPRWTCTFTSSNPATLPGLTTYCSGTTSAATAQDRELYERTKRELIRSDWADMNAYADAKTAVVSQIKERARKAT